MKILTELCVFFAKTLIVNGANVNAADSNGKRGLFVAAASGCLSIVEVRYYLDFWLSLNPCKSMVYYP